MTLLFRLFKSGFTPYLIVSILTVLVWHKILFQVPLGEGYYYFDHGQDFITAQGKLSDLGQTDNFARFIFYFLPTFFHDNLTLYMAFQLTTMVALNLTFYYLVNHLTKNRWIALTAALLFSTSYIAQFEMLGTGNYQRFVQRIPALIPLFFALIQLNLYLTTRRAKNFLISLTLYAFAVLMGHFSTFLTPLFVIYPIAFSILQRTSLKVFWQTIPIVMSYPIINYLLILSDHLTPTESILYFIHQKGLPFLIQQIFLEMGGMLIPPFLLEKIAAISYPFSLNVIAVTIPLSLILIVGIFIVFRRRADYLLIYLVSLIVIPILLFLNLYLGKVDPAYDIRGYNYYFLPTYYLNSVDFTSVKGDRYYLVPYFFISIVISILIWAIFNKRQSTSISKSYQVVVIVFLAFQISSNTQIIWQSLDKLQPISDVTRQYITFNKSIRHQFTNQTMILAPRTLLWPSTMIRVFYGQPDMQFRLFRPGWEDEIIGKKTQDILIFDYDYTTHRIIDLTPNFRNGQSLALPKYQ